MRKLFRQGRVWCQPIIRLCGSINIGLQGQFASWVGSLISPENKVIIVADGEAGVREAVMRMARVGLENVVGYLDGGIAVWEQVGLELATVPQIPVDELRSRLDEQSDLQMDVRPPTEYATGHIPGAVNAELAHLEDKAGELDQSRRREFLNGAAFAIS